MAKKIIKLNEKDIIKITGDVINELLHKDLGDKEALYEMALIGPMSNILEVFVNTNDGGYIPHFHIWDSSTRGSEFHTCIRYDCPEYFHHSGKEDTLNSREKKSLDAFFKEPSRNKRFSTNWEYALSMWNDNNSSMNIPEDLKQPDYTRLP